MVKEYNPYLEYVKDELFLEGVSLRELAEKYGTPLYVYSASYIRDRLREYRESFPGALICYAVKANFNPHIVSLMAGEGAGADIVSGGELYVALMAGVNPSRIVYAGVGKTVKELVEAIKADILMFNVESRMELEILNQLGEQLGKKVRISIRVNPHVDPKTHPYIATGMKKSKFGIDIDRAEEEYRYALSMKNIQVVGVHCHIGSQILDTSPYVEAVSKVVDLYRSLEDQGIELQYLDIGGGLGIKYKPEDRALTPMELSSALSPILQKVKATVVLEPGRSLVGNAGVLITQVQFVKDKGEKHFVIVDAGMNDLIRPAIYDAYHHILPVVKRGRPSIVTDVVGPICETGDFLAKDRQLEEVGRGDYLAVLSAGAYGFAMSSHYNVRPRACEVLVDRGYVRVIREREDYQYILSKSS
ncbi:diaminopimelate decarboxylase [Thermocrinis albus DSM 14484]|uniref:Diaminopimelate decarboxylase n=1 Tax=Thermocrinis albus (strain DSM 14484 / JCM 11386 / HI 11/12) TaxID=638303 RepID=D3SL32_THEAH|nr:diaminopimelate decarboxylase [Thermocrinis albus]ADC89462.1 diaminopimelate decarboxylase [Thermocrinis albus DSM 14484]